MATAYQERKISDPALNVGDEPYFAAAGEGKLMVGKCSACAKVHHYPRPLCPFCFSDKVSQVQANGNGTVYSYSVSRRVGPVVFCIAYVQLDEGVKMLTNIVDCDLDTVKIGQKVKVVFKKSGNGTAVAMFTPA